MKAKAQKESKRSDKAKMYRLAQYITSQAQLNLVLMAMPDPHNRGVFYELLKPCIKLFKPEYQDLVRTYRPDVHLPADEPISDPVDVEIGPELYRVN